AFRYDGTAILGDHRQRPLRKIAEIVGKVGIGAVDDGFVAIAAVLTERHFAQEEITDLVKAVMFDHLERIDDIADRFGHFLAAVEEKTVTENALRQVDAGRHQERRPVYGVKPHNVLADDMRVGWPKAPFPIIFIWI